MTQTHVRHFSYQCTMLPLLNFKKIHHAYPGCQRFLYLRLVFSALILGGDTRTSGNQGTSCTNMHPNFQTKMSYIDFPLLISNIYSEQNNCMNHKHSWQLTCPPTQFTKIFVNIGPFGLKI